MGGSENSKALRDAEALFAGGKNGKRHFVGAVVVQPVEAVDRFVKTAAAGAEFVYCEASEPQYGATWSHVGALARGGLVNPLHRRRAGGGWQYYIVRTGRSLPKQQSPQEKVLGDRATLAIFNALKQAASRGLPCPSDTDLAEAAGLNTRDQAKWRFRELIRVELIRSTLAYERNVPSRVVTILQSKWAGAAADKFTALPKQYAANRAAAERELRAEDERELRRLREAGL